MSLLEKRVVDRGAWYLRTAAYDTTKFLQDANWEHVKNEEGRILWDLFFGAAEPDT